MRYIIGLITAITLGLPATAAHKAPAPVEAVELVPPDGHITSTMCEQILPGSVALAEVVSGFLYPDTPEKVVDNQYWLLDGGEGVVMAMAAVVEDYLQHPRPPEYQDEAFDPTGWFMVNSSHPDKNAAILIGSMDSGCTMVMMMGGTTWFEEWADHIDAIWFQVELSPSPEVDYYRDLEATLDKSSAVLPGGSDGEIEGFDGIDPGGTIQEKPPDEFCEVCEYRERGRKRYL